LSFAALAFRCASISSIIGSMRFSSLYAGTTTETRMLAASEMDGKGARALREREQGMIV
jgi:hypothetical protein